MASVRKALLTTQGNFIESCKGNKVTIVGAGHLGMASAFSILIKGVSGIVVLVDKDADKLRGETLDLQEGSHLLKQACIKCSTDFKDTENSKVCIITAGSTERAGETREDMLRRNYEVIKDVVPKIVAASPDCVLIVAIPPVDMMTYAAWRVSGLQHHRVLGTGTNLDSMRLRGLIAQRLNVNPTAVDAWVVGEEGENSVAVWSGVVVGGVLLRNIVQSVGADGDVEEWDKLHKDSIQSHRDVVSLKGQSSWSLALGVCYITKAVVKNTNQVLAVSTYIKGCKHGQDKAVYMSLPCVVGGDGIAYILKQQLDESEKRLLHVAAKRMQDDQIMLNV